MCGRKLRIVWIKPAQKGLKLCFTCKASHAQDPARMILAQLACINRTAITKHGMPILGMNSTLLGVQVQHACQDHRGWAEHHNLANTTLYSLQSIANATWRGKAE